MTKLIVTPIDPTQPGSYKARKQYMETFRKLRRLRSDGNNVDEVIEAYDAVESLLLPRLRTDNGVSVEDALNQLSADEFDQLLEGVTFGSVPPVSANSSSSRSKARGKARRG